MTKYINICKILIILLSCQPSNLISILEYNITNYLDFLLNNNKKDISLRALNNNKKRIIKMDINNSKKDIKLVDINK